MVAEGSASAANSAAESSVLLASREQSLLQQTRYSLCDVILGYTRVQSERVCVCKSACLVSAGCRSGLASGPTKGPSSNRRLNQCLCNVWIRLVKWRGSSTQILFTSTLCDNKNGLDSEKLFLNLMIFLANFASFLLTWSHVTCEIHTGAQVHQPRWLF